MANRKKEADQFIKIAEDNIPGGQEEQAGDLVKQWREGKMAMLL
jgi:hypothetical protein